MLVPNRHGSSDSYRYGFNGMELDNELKGEGNSYDYGARMHDPRVGRFLSRDPFEKQLAFLSPYNSFANNPIIFIDKEGKIFEIPENLTHAQKVKVQFMLDVLKRVAPVEYELLNSSPVKISISVGIIPTIKAGSVTNGVTTPPTMRSVGMLKDKDSDYKTTGDYQTDLKTAYSNNNEMFQVEFDNNENPQSTLVDIPENIANKMIRFGKEGFGVVVADNLDSEGLSKTGGHEFGHVYFGLANPAYSFLLDDSMIKGSFGGHVENDQTTETHPNGKIAFKYAMKVEVFQATPEYKEMLKQFKQDLKAAVKEDKEEEKKNKKKK